MNNVAVAAAPRSVASRIGQKLHTWGYYASVLGFRQTLLLQTARLLRKPVVGLRIPGIPYPVQCRPTNSDRFTLGQVFIERDSDVSLTQEPRFIIDGGANVGYASIVFANKYPRAQIIAVEPEVGNYRLAAENCRTYPNVRVIQGGIWTSDSPLVIGNPQAESWSFKVREVEHTTANAIKGYTIATLLSQSGFETIDLLKLDIEGAEEHIFSATDTAWLDHVRVLVIETHGERAEHAVKTALLKRTFTQSQQGEKLIFVNRAFSSVHES
jgi:FkbM family methyltransferase